MRLSSISKPISSPGRTEKFPPPLMRFLRSNVGSKSNRGRGTRKTSMFMRRKKASSSAIDTAQEPTSPKVTCIGQVRVRRSKSKGRSSNVDSNKKLNVNDSSNNSKCCYGCCWFRMPSLCKLDLRCSNVRKWVLLFNCRSVKVRTDSSKYGSSRFEQDDHQREGVKAEDKGRPISVSVESLETETEEMTSTTPPKNAFLLTRCRSAPYRSSSLACRFWGSPLRAEQEEEEAVAENRPSGIELSRDSTSSESRGDRDSEGRRSSSTSLKKDIGFCAHVQDQNTNTSTDEMKDTLYGGIGGVKVECIREPLMMLMRCKSEPARRRDSENLDPTSSEFWRHRRSGNAESSSTTLSHAVD